MRFGDMRIILLAFVLFCAPLPCVAADSTVLDRTVAIVNGEIILYSEILEQEKWMEKFAPDIKLSDPETKAKVEKEILSQMIRQKLTEQEVKRMKINISNAEVDEQLEQVMRENRLSKYQFEATLKESGQTIEKFRDGIKKELERNRLIERMLRSKTVITDAQVDAFLKSDSGLVAGEEKIRLGIIFLPVDSAHPAAEVEKTGLEISEKLKAGGDFRQFARQYSKGPAVQEGGDIGFLSHEELSPGLAGAVKDLKKGEMTGLVKGSNGYYILKVFDIDQQKLSKSDPSAREKVRKELYQKELNRKFDEWVRNLESKAFIQISL